jgi:pyrimidine-nucleoside phosphorylase
MTLRDLIERKRDGGHIPASEWREFTRALGAGELPDYQVSALLMAIYFRGLDEDETVALLEGMIASGKTLHLDHLTMGRVDKHSTGGVGDKVSLILAPLVAACGVAVPMMSGRGLGHTGGTLDKLESIPGFDTRLSLAQATAQVERLGCALIGQTGEIAPADKKLYAMRDATATVEAIPLIAASIMSKKLSESLTGLVLDVKTGVGAFLPKLDDSIRLAQTMIGLGARHNVPVVALLTNMDAPLGVACGNANEVVESIETIRGGGPADLRELTLRLGTEMLVLGGAATTIEAARERLERAIASGAALEKFRAIVEAQGGDPRVCDDPRAIVAQPAVSESFVATRGGYVTRIDPRTVGKGITAMGGGRTKMDDIVDPSVGFLITTRLGQAVRKGDQLAMIQAKDATTLAAGRTALAAAFSVEEDGKPVPLLVSHRISSDGVQLLG